MRRSCRSVTAQAEGIIGFTVCSTRNKPVHHDAYMRLYAMIQELGKPLAFHSGYHWGDPSFTQLNRFISMHALSFTHYNQIHVTNWIVNAMPERFPRLQLLWVESGLAWIPFLMQRLDHEVADASQRERRVCKRLPSEYMREMYYTSQPLERGNSLRLLRSDHGGHGGGNAASVLVRTGRIGIGTRRLRSRRCRSSPARRSGTFSV